jgi:hypothetical protein
MTNQEVRAFAAAIILAGQYAEGATQRDMMVQEAILTADALLEGLDDMEPLKKRIEGFYESRRKRTEATEKLLAENKARRQSAQAVAFGNQPVH